MTEILCVTGHTNAPGCQMMACGIRRGCHRRASSTAAAVGSKLQQSALLVSRPLTMISCIGKGTAALGAPCWRKPQLCQSRVQPAVVSCVAIPHMATCRMQDAAPLNTSRTQSEKLAHWQQNRRKLVLFQTLPICCRVLCLHIKRTICVCFPSSMCGTASTAMSPLKLERKLTWGCWSCPALMAAQVLLLLMMRQSMAGVFDCWDTRLHCSRSTDEDRVWARVRLVECWGHHV
jgi:hypothetical protein